VLPFAIFNLIAAHLPIKPKSPTPGWQNSRWALRRLSNFHSEFVYAKITKLIKIGTRMIQRLRHQLGLAVPAKKLKRRGQGHSQGVPKTKHNGHIWAWDFVHDTTMRGGKLTMPNVIDEYTSECLCIYVDRRMNARKVKGVLSDLVDVCGAPEHIRRDYEPEFIEKDLRK
jgi:putative transposase